MSLKQEIDELEKKAVKYDGMKSKIDEWNKKLIELIKIAETMQESLKQLSYDIKPTGTVKITMQKSTGIKWDEIVAEWYEKMQAGTDVTRDLIEKTYPEWDYNSIGTLIARLGKCKGVDKVRIGKGKKLFVRKEFR